MGVTCQILIDKPVETVHKAGKPVTGGVKFAISVPTEYEGVTLSFLGKGKCSWSESTIKNSSYYHGSEDYIIQHVDIINKSPEESIILYGVYKYPFRFYLPKDISKSFKDPTGSIIYSLQLKFMKSNIFSFDNVFTAEIPVYGPVDLTTNDGVPMADVPIIFGL